MRTRGARRGQRRPGLRACRDPGPRRWEECGYSCRSCLTSTKTPTTSGDAMDGLVLTVERMIRASPEVIFTVLADPSKHSSIDGSGML